MSVNREVNDVKTLDYQQAIINVRQKKIDRAEILNSEGGSSKDEIIYTLKPTEFINLFYPGSGLTTQTIRNWIKSKKLESLSSASGRMLVVVRASSLKKFMETEKDSVSKLVDFLRN